MGFRTIVVNEHCKLSYKNNHLIFRSADCREMIHLSEIDILLLETTDITITTMLLKRLIDERVLVLFCDDKRLPVSQLLPFYGRHDSSLQLSRQVEWPEEIKQEIWTDIIYQKISNQAKFLDQLGLHEKGSAILTLRNELETFDPSNREGHTARIYFHALFGPEFTREQETTINAGLDYGYTLLMSVFARAIVTEGCLTQFGLKHANQFNDFNLASDLMEPFRPLVDQLVYSNRNRSFNQIKSELFTLFSTTYPYQKKSMYLTNIVNDYTKKVVKALNQNQKGVPEFRI